jgi:hypothetical protein
LQKQSHSLFYFHFVLLPYFHFASGPPLSIYWQVSVVSVPECCVDWN